jgi:predicted MFS family arabinose efflux permease
LLLVPVGLLIAPSMAASAETVSGLAPDHVRGLVTGLHGSAITLGATIATPLAGLLVDIASPAVAVLTVGAAGVGAAILVALLSRPGPRASRDPLSGLSTDLGETTSQ